MVLFKAFFSELSMPLCLLELDFYDFNKTYLIFASLFDGYDNGTGDAVRTVYVLFKKREEPNQNRNVMATF